MIYYKDDLTTLHNDMFENVIDYISFDKVITSPPYNIIRPNSKDRGYDKYKDGMSNEEYIEWTIKMFKSYEKGLSKNGAILYNISYGTENTELMSLVVAEIIKRTNFTIADVIVWKKSSATPNNMSSNKMTRIVEFIYVFCRRTEFNSFTANKQVVSFRETGQKNYQNMFNFFSAKNNDGAQSLNKATFSCDFVNELINRYVLPTDTVLDNFSGTGTTLVACIERGIRSIGIELSEGQCEYARKRIINVSHKLL
jgi:DNA modification methylase